MWATKKGCLELVCNHLWGRAAPWTQENCRKRTITRGQKELEPPSPGSQQGQPRSTVSRVGNLLWVLLGVPGQRGASFNSLVRKSEHRCLFPFLRESAGEIRGQEALGPRISSCSAIHDSRSTSLIQAKAPLLHPSHFRLCSGKMCQPWLLTRGHGSRVHVQASPSACCVTLATQCFCVSISSSVKWCGHPAWHDEWVCRAQRLQGELGCTQPFPPWLCSWAFRMRIPQLLQHPCPEDLPLLPLPVR